MPTVRTQETQRRSHLRQTVYTAGMPGEWLWGSRSRYSEHDIYNRELLGDSSQRWHVLAAASTQPANSPAWTVWNDTTGAGPGTPEQKPHPSHCAFTEAAPAAAPTVSTVCLISKPSQKQRGKQQEGWHLSSSLVKGLLSEPINSVQVNHTIIWVENIAKLASAQCNGETSVSFCTRNYLEGKYTLLQNCYPLSLYCRHLQSYQKSLDAVL